MRSAAVSCGWGRATDFRPSVSCCPRFFQEILAGKLAGSPPEPLAKSERTGVPPVDWLAKNHRAVKLSAYGESLIFMPGLGSSTLELGRDRKSVV